MKLENIIHDLQPTRLVYLEDSYRADFKATILRAQLEGRRNIYLVLDATAFHPKSGGQPSDTGVLLGSEFMIKVKKTILLQEKVIHLGIAEGKLSANVVGTVNWKSRYIYMLRHTAGHLLDHCLTIATGTPVKTVDSWLGEDCFVAYWGKAPTEKILDRAVRICNKLIARGAPVSIEEVNFNDLLIRSPEAPNLSRLPIRQHYRIVTIKGCKPIPCTGTHLHDIREIKAVSAHRILESGNVYRVYLDVEEPTT